MIGLGDGSALSMAAQAAGGLLVGASIVVPKIRRARALGRRLRSVRKGWRRAQIRQQAAADEAVRRAVTFDPLGGRGGTHLWDSTLATPQAPGASVRAHA